MRRFGLAVWLVVVWIFLWGDLSLANVLGGAAVAVALLVAFPGDRPDVEERQVLRPLHFLSLLWFLAKVMIFLMFFIQVRWTLPRFRYDQLMNIGWKVMLPAALANILITGFLVVSFGRS